MVWKQTFHVTRFESNPELVSAKFLFHVFALTIEHFFKLA